MSATEPLRAAALAVCVAAGLWWAPAADAEPADELEQGIAAVRAGGSCGALRQDALAEQSAEISNRSTEDYLNHLAEYVPVADPLVVLRDLGSSAGAAVQLQGYGDDAATAIKGALLQGYSSIVDCSYDSVGTSVIRNPERGYTLVVAVLAGP